MVKIEGKFNEELYLTNETGRYLYHTYAEHLPIIDYHCHLNPKEIAEDTIGFIRRTLREMFGPVAADIRILYGGSVKPNNIAEYMSEPDIDGALVGGASLELASYQALIENLR